MRIMDFLFVNELFGTRMYSKFSLSNSTGILKSRANKRAYLQLIIDINLLT